MDNLLSIDTQPASPPQYESTPREGISKSLSALPPSKHLAFKTKLGVSEHAKSGCSFGIYELLAKSRRSMVTLDVKPGVGASSGALRLLSEDLAKTAVKTS